MPFTLRSPSLLEIVVFGGSLFSLVFFAIWRPGESGRNCLPYVNIFVLAVVQICALSPLLISKDNQIEPRMLTVTQWLSAFLFFTQLFKIVSKFSKQREIQSQNRTKINVSKTTCQILIVALLLSTSNFRYYNYIYEPYLEKIEFIESELRKCQVTDKIVVLSRTKAWPSRPLLGVWSQVTDLSSDWVPVPAIANQLSLNTTFGIEKVDTIREFKFDMEFKCVIDLNQFGVSKNIQT
jgi:hypothetical protein